MSAMLILLPQQHTNLLNQALLAITTHHYFQITIKYIQYEHNLFHNHVIVVDMTIYVYKINTKLHEMNKTLCTRVTHTFTATLLTGSVAATVAAAAAGASRLSVETILTIPADSAASIEALRTAVS